MNSKTAVVTGASSGIGRATARILADNGFRVYALSRRPLNPENTIFVECDVTDDASVKSAAEFILKDCGDWVDLLVNCAGFGISGAVEFTDIEDAKRQLDVNFFGCVRVTQAFLTSMRNNRCGRIINVGSVASWVPIPFQAFYSASKAAIASYSAALANEVKPYGVEVTVILPGDIRTGFTASRKKVDAGDRVYGGRISRGVAAMEKDELNGMTSDDAGAYIAKIAQKSAIKPFYALGFKYFWACLAIRCLPASFTSKLLYNIYAK